MRFASSQQLCLLCSFTCIMRRKIAAPRGLKSVGRDHSSTPKLQLGHVMFLMRVRFVLQMTHVIPHDCWAKLIVTICALKA